MISGIQFFTLRYKKSGSPGGFSLLEVLISIAIFTTALLAISVMLLNTIKGNTLSVHLTNASQLASMQKKFFLNIFLTITMTELTLGFQKIHPTIALFRPRLKKMVN